MDDLITPPKELDPQERVMQTMELQTDTQLQVEKFGEKMTYWDQTLAPQEPAENTDDSQVIIVHNQTIPTFHFSVGKNSISKYFG